MRRLAFWLTVGFIFTVPWEAAIQVGSIGRVSRALGLVAAAVWAVSVVTRGRLRQPDTFVKAYFLFLVWDLDVTGWLASAGIVGIAVGFGAKDTVANFFAGVFILADAPYRIGDFIILDTGERGRVTHIGLRSTRLLTRDDIEVTVPNAVMGNTKIINETGGPHKKERIRIKITCAYGSDIDHVKKVLCETAVHLDGVCTDPEPRVRFRAFGPSGLELELLGWIEEPVLRGRITDALNTEVYRRFNEEKIEIPYLKQDVYIKEMPR